MKELKVEGNIYRFEVLGNDFLFAKVIEKDNLFITEYNTIFNIINGTFVNINLAQESIKKNFKKYINSFLDEDGNVKELEWDKYTIIYNNVYNTKCEDYKIISKCKTFNIYYEEFTNVGYNCDYDECKISLDLYKMIEIGEVLNPHIDEQITIYKNLSQLIINDLVLKYK